MCAKSRECTPLNREDTCTCQGRIQRGGDAWDAQAPPLPQPRQHTGFNGHLAEQPALVPPSNQKPLSDMTTKSCL